MVAGATSVRLARFPGCGSGPLGPTSGRRAPGSSTFSKYEARAASVPTSWPAASERNQRCSSSSWKTSDRVELVARDQPGCCAATGSYTSLSQRLAATTSDTGRWVLRSRWAAKRRQVVEQAPSLVLLGHQTGALIEVLAIVAGLAHPGAARAAGADRCRRRPARSP